MERGRPRKDRSEYVNRQYNQLFVLAIRRSDQTKHPMCRVKCLACGQKSTKRIDDVVRGRVKTCGCGAKKAFDDYISRRLAKLSDSEIEKIWCQAQEGRSSRDLAVELKNQKAVVDAAIRKHQRRLDDMTEERKLVIWTIAQEKGYEAAGAEYGLNSRSSAYIVQRMENSIVDPRESNEDLVERLQAIRYVTKMEPEPGEKWFYAGEFRKDDLHKKRTGLVVGGLSALYYRLKRFPLNSPNLNPELKDLIRWFLSTATWTFESRTKRQQMVLDELRKQKLLDRQTEAVRRRLEAGIVA